VIIGSYIATGRQIRTDELDRNKKNGELLATTFPLLHPRICSTAAEDGDKEISTLFTGVNVDYNASNRRRLYCRVLVQNVLLQNVLPQNVLHYKMSFLQNVLPPNDLPQNVLPQNVHGY
jgi:hypothetical protein